jgi:hypothetical protein
MTLFYTECGNILGYLGSSNTDPNGGPIHGEQGAHQAQSQEALPIRWLCCQGVNQGIVLANIKLSLKELCQSRPCRQGGNQGSFRKY